MLNHPVFVIRTCYLRIYINLTVACFARISLFLRVKDDIAPEERLDEIIQGKEQRFEGPGQPDEIIDPGQAGVGIREPEIPEQGEPPADICGRIGVDDRAGQHLVEYRPVPFPDVWSQHPEDDVPAA